MSCKPSPRLFSALAFLALLIAFGLPTQPALAGGCCFTEIAIKSLATGRQVTLSGATLTTPYDLSTFFSFADFTQPIAKPSRLGPGYEVAREGWDHLIYYPGGGDQAGAVYYEGLFNGSSEYDQRWFAVPAQQDAPLRQMLVAQGFQPGPPPQTLATIVAGAMVVGLLLVLLGLWLFPLRYSRGRRYAAAAIRKE